MHYIWGGELYYFLYIILYKILLFCFIFTKSLTKNKKETTLGGGGIISTKFVNED